MANKKKKEDNPFVEKSAIKKVQIVKPGEIDEGEKKPISVRTERFLDRHNHKMEFLRTFFGFTTIALQVVILAKIFGLI
jgi:hypothetical protein|tara:strand:- start:1496 stop:1732 length:237 start_codon:yes stop_codon:yes gene_type:complete